MIIISDTSAITNLYQIGYLDLLKELYGEITVTPGVRRELYRIESQKDVIQNTDWIKTAYPSNQLLINELLAELDLGEAESIALALELKAEYLVIDEFKGREVAQRYDIRIVGLLVILVLAKKKEIITEIRPLVNQLLEIGFRLNRRLVDTVLKSLGEL